MEIYFTLKFRKSYEKLPKQIKRKAELKEKLFRQNPFYPLLETHLIHGKYEDCWSFSVDQSYRVMFRFLDATKNRVAFINIGTHEIYK